MVHVATPRPSIGSAFGEAAGSIAGGELGYQRNRSRLQSAFQQAQNTVNQMKSTGQYDPTSLLFALGQAGAGIPGWQQVVSETFPVISEQIRNQILANRAQGKAGAPSPVAVQEEISSPSMATAQEAGQISANQPGKVPSLDDLLLQSAQLSPKRTTLPGGGILKEGSVGVPAIEAASLADEWNRIYQENVDLLGPEKSANLATQKTGLTQKDIENKITGAKATQELATGERQLENDFLTKSLTELNAQFPGLDKFDKDQFALMSRKYKNLPDEERKALTYNDWINWKEQRNSVQNVMTPNLITRFTGGKKGVLDQIHSSIKPFINRGLKEQQIAISSLTKNGLSLPEAYEAVYETSKPVKNYISNLGDFPKFEAPPFGLTKAVREKRANELKQESDLIDSLGKKLPKLIRDSDSLISILYKLQEKGWNQQAYVRALDIAQKNGLKLNDRQLQERVKLAEDMRPGFWDIIKNFGKY